MSMSLQQPSIAAMLTWLPCALAAAALVYLHACVLLPRLKEPDEPDGKPLYAQMPTHRFVLGCLSAALFTQIVAIWVPLALRPAAVVVGGSVVVAVAVDLVSTWLPLALHRWCAAELAAALGLGCLFAPAGAVRLIVGALLGAAGAGGLFWAVWRFTKGGIGFGDVRLMTLLGAAAAAHSERSWWLMMVAGSLIGVIWGLAGRLRGKAGAFAYGPALWLGWLLAMVLSSTVLPAPG